MVVRAAQCSEVNVAGRASVSAECVNGLHAAKSDGRRMREVHTGVKCFSVRCFSVRCFPCAPSG